MLTNCCCGCTDGQTIPRWQNVTQVRPVADPTPAGTPVAPFQRYDSDEYLSEHGIGHSCDDDNPAGSGSDFSGYCGEWFGSAGDTNALSSQVVKDTVDDIMACAGDDATHAKIDHDCYAVNGTVDMKAKRLGAMWVYAKKFWHGTPPWTDKDYCTPDPTNAPNQVRYRRVDVILTEVHYDAGSNGLYSDTASGGVEVDRYSGITTSNLLTTQDIFTALFSTPNSAELDLSGSMVSGRQVEHISGGGGWQAGPPPLYPNHGVSTIIDTMAGADMHCANQPIDFASFIDGWNAVRDTYLAHPELGTAPPLAPTITDNNHYSFSGSFSLPAITNPDHWTYSGELSITFDRTATTYSFTFIASYFLSWDSPDDSPPSPTPDYTSASGSYTLSDPYTSADCLQDWKAAMAAWNAADRNLAKLRTDEKLALAPLILYDEIAPQTPLQGFLPATMDNYAGGLVDDLNGNHPGSHAGDVGQKPTGAPVDYIQTWAQTAWHDTNDYKWLGANGSVNYSPVDASGNPPDDTTLAGVSFGILKTGLRTGIILAHVKGTPLINGWSGAGADRHFWFGYVEMKRICCVEDCSTGYTWVSYRNGGFSDPDLPPVTMRWMDNAEAQYDGELCNPSAYSRGNFDQSWLDQRGGYIVGGKYLVATQKWPAVKFCRPCGVDKYAVEQTTVCCISSGDAGSGFVVTNTNNATAPLAAGGLTGTDYILVNAGTADDGLYLVSSITGTGPWTVNVGAKLDTLPAGLGDQSIAPAGYLGRLRWVGYTNYAVTFDSAPGICLRVPVTTSYAAGVLTVNTDAAQPFFRKGIEAALRPVNLYDASMTLLASSLVLARTDDSHFTTTTTNHPTAVWMMDAQFATAISAGASTDWTLYDGTSKRTYCKIEHTFNQRQAALPTAGQPHWLGWTADVDGERGIAGCLTQDISQYAYDSSKCPAFIGIAPFYGDPSAPVETFPGGVKNKMFPMPSSLGFDGVWGAHFQARLAISMTDCFWQNPFMPSCAGPITWAMDDGSGTGNYAHCPLVEALSAVPSGASLPTGLTLPYDPANVISPPFYSNGIPTSGGSYKSFETDWGFAIRACGSMAFDYPSWVDCSNV